MIAPWDFTLKNHLRIGWLSLKAAQEQETRVFVTQIGACERPPLKPMDEAIAAAKQVSKKFGPRLVLCMSGGIDSECMALAFLRANIPFRVAIARYGPGDLNSDDTIDAFRFCQKNEIPVEIFDIDLVAFFESSKHLDYAHKYTCRSPQLAVHIHLLSMIREKMDAVPIMSGNPIDVDFDPECLSPNLILPSEPHFCYLRYFVRERCPGVPFFFAYTPELIYSFWQTEQFRLELENTAEKFCAWRERRPGFTRKNARKPVSSYAGKVLKFQQGGFAVDARDGKKTGFESAKVFFRDYFFKKGCTDSMFSHEPFDYFFRRPVVELYPYPSPVSQIVPSAYFPRPDLLEEWRLSVCS